MMHALYYDSKIDSILDKEGKFGTTFILSYAAGIIDVFINTSQNLFGAKNVHSANILEFGIAKT